jgi:hypothetical protein
MALDVGTFKGEAPRIAPRLLPNDMGQLSTNARLISGNLEAWKDFTSSTTQQIQPNPITIYYLDDQLWLTWGGTSPVKLLMHFDDVAGNTWIDVFGHTVIDQTSCGPGFTQENSVVLFGAGSVEGFNYCLNLEVTSGISDFNFGTGDFTIEVAMQWTNDINVFIWSQANYPNPNLQFQFTSGTGFTMALGAGTQTVAYTTDVFNTWHRFCYMRKSGSCYIFVDGVVIGSYADPSNYGGGVLSNPDIFQVLSPTLGNFYCDELRVSAIAQYPITGYTVATSAFTDVPGGSGNVEVDVAKMAIGGDTSYRTIFCGTDVPRFTDLGLASGLVDGSGHPITGSSSLQSGALPSGGPFPIYSRKLGVPNPLVAIASPKLVPAGPGANALTITETFDGATQWNLVDGQPGFGIADIPLTGGNPGACLNTRAIGGNLAYGWKTFGIENTDASTVQVDFAYQRNNYDYEQQTTLTFFCCLDSSVSGTLINLQVEPSGINWNTQAINSGAYGGIIQTGSIASVSIPTWVADPSGDPNWTGPWRNNHWYTATLTITPQANPNVCQITLVIMDGSTTVLTITSNANLPNAGPGFGFGCTVPAGFSMPYWAEINFDNLIINGTGPATTPASIEATSYLYTLVNDLGEESGPSPAMTTADGTGVIQRPAGQGVQVTLPGTLAATGVDVSYFYGGTTYIPTTQIPPNASIPSPSMNLYRAVTGSSGTSFLLVEANIPFSGGSSTVYVDSVADAALSEEIASLLWSPPDTSMVGILALPNGIYAGFHGNELDLAVQAIPHAWPIEYRLNFDWDIVGIEAIDSTIVVCTKKFPYLCSGNTPDAYSSTKASYPYACASKRSIKYLKGIGVVFATFEGLVAIAGPGIEKLITESLFSKDEWLALNPSSMIADVNDNRYFCWYTTVGGTKGGFYIDVNDGAAGKVSMGQHVIARYNDPLTDTLYEVLDYSSTGTTTGIIVGFNTAASTLMPYTWKSKQFFLPWPTAYQFCRVSADSYASLTLNLFADGTQYGGNITITSQTEFSLPLPPNGVCFKYFEFELIGTDKVNRVQFVEDIEEFQ